MRYRRFYVNATLRNASRTKRNGLAKSNKPNAGKSVLKLRKTKLCCQLVTVSHNINTHKPMHSIDVQIGFRVLLLILIDLKNHLSISYDGFSF